MSEPLIVIGLTGVAESGKDTVAQMLAHHRYRFFRVALADTVRAMLRDLDGPTGAFTKELTRAGLTPRWAQQRIGGDARERTGRSRQYGTIGRRRSWPRWRFTTARSRSTWRGSGRTSAPIATRSSRAATSAIAARFPPGG